jgi:glycine dehydrogenase subunit 1
LGADLVAGEGGHLGQPLNYGGPGLGFLATQQKHLRSLPGRLVGETLDQTGKRCFVLTLSTREQHIRRQKATSNICTNQSLCALAFTLMVSLLGKNGFQKLAYLNLAKNQFLTERLGERKIRPYFSSATFNERLYGPFNKPAPGILEELQRRGFIAGLAVGDYFPEIPDLQNTLLICTTEEHPRSQIEAMAEALKKVNR